MLSTSSLWTPTVGGVGWGGSWDLGSWDPLSLFPFMPLGRRVAGNVWINGTLSSVAFALEEVGLRKKGGYCTGLGWSSGTRQAGHTSHCLQFVGQASSQGRCLFSIMQTMSQPKKAMPR